MNNRLTLILRSGRRIYTRLTPLTSDYVFQETSTPYGAVKPDQWLRRHPEAGSSWPSWPKASQPSPLVPSTSGGLRDSGFGSVVYGLWCMVQGLVCMISCFRTGFHGF